MHNCIVFEHNKEPRLHTSRQEIKVYEVTDQNGMKVESHITEFVDTRGDVFYGYFIVYADKKPRDEEVCKAIDNLKPIGLKYETQRR